MKSKYKGKVPRTSGWQSQDFFDNEISHMDVSSLRFLKFKYNKDIKEFPLYFDMNSEEHLKLYQEMLQRKRMIDEELEARSIYDNQERTEFYDSNSEVVLDKDGNPIYGVSLNEDETKYIYNHEDGGIVETPIAKEQEDDESDEDDEEIVHTEPIRVGRKIVGILVTESTRERKDIYKDWNYVEDEETNW